jgi:hypothetical protein
MREHAILSLFGYGLHTGMLYSDTPHIIPFVLEVLALESYSDKPYLLTRLYSVGLHTYLSGANIAHMKLAVSTHEALASGLDMYIDLLNSPDPEIRFYTARLLRYFQEQATKTLTALTLRHSIESNQRIRVTILHSMSELMKNAYLMYHKSYQTYVDFIITNITDNTHLIERYVALSCIEFMNCHVEKDLDIMMDMVKKEYELLPKSKFDNPANPLYFEPPKL